MTARLALAALLLPTPLLATSPVPPEAAAAEVRTDLQSATAELNALREQIARERLPLASRLRELESAVAKRRAEVVRLRQASGLERDRRERLRAEAAQAEAEVAAVRSALLEYRRDLETRLTPAEAQERAAALQEWEQALTAATPAELPALTEKWLADSAQWITSRLAPRRFPGVASDADGRERSGDFLQWGPLTLFAPSEGTPGISWALQEPDAVLPRRLPMPSEAESIVRAALDSGRGFTAPVDLVEGGALRVEAARESLVEHLVAGGVLMIPIGLVGAVAFLLVLLKAVSLARMRAWQAERIDRVVEHLRAGRMDAARADARQAPRPLRAVLLGAVDHPGADHDRLEEILHERILGEAPGLERHLASLAVLASVAPLLGLLGTVTGMIHTFTMIQLAGAGDPRLLSGGISEALITTEAGLVVAIPTLLVHAGLSRRVRALVGQLERAAVAVANRLHGAEAEAA
jgi:biopolymer transport protein ExbB